LPVAQPPKLKAGKCTGLGPGTACDSDSRELGPRVGPGADSESEASTLRLELDRELPSESLGRSCWPVPEDWPVFLPGGAIAINLKAPVTGGCHGDWEPCSLPLPWYSRPTEQRCAASRSQPCVASSGIEKLYGYVRL
jgi:hypothetical protein